MKICMSSLYCVRSTSKVDASDAWQPVAWHSNQTIHTSSYSLSVIITPLDTNAHTSERARVHIRMNGGVRSKSTQAFGWFFFFCLLDADGPMCWLVPAAASAAGAVWRSNNMELTPTPTTVYSIIDTFGWLLNAYGGFGFGITLRSRVCLLKIFPVDICELWHCILACNMAPDLL